jgi:hypothetical protein
MKVKIGKYLNWYGPYQLVDMLFFWVEKYPEKELANRWDYRLHDKMGTWLADTWVAPICQWIHDKRKRTVKVKIHNYDVWNMGDTLAIVILPMLKELKRQKQGCPWSDHEDGPWYYKFDRYDEEHNWDEKGSYSHGRWDWIMDEMIWTFEQLTNEDHEDAYWLERGEIDWDHKEPDENGCTPLIWKKESRVDWDGLKKHNDQIQNGLRLFGKYYQNLWD